MNKTKTIKTKLAHGTRLNFLFFISSLEMEEERVYNEMSSFHNIAGGSATGSLAAAAHANSVHRTRTVSSPVPVNVSQFNFT